MGSVFFVCPNVGGKFFGPSDECRVLLPPRDALPIPPLLPQRTGDKRVGGLASHARTFFVVVLGERPPGVRIARLPWLYLRLTESLCIGKAGIRSRRVEVQHCCISMFVLRGIRWG